jgi:hypothetical protein
MGGGELTTDATNNLFWNTSQVNSQRGFATIFTPSTFTTIADTNITANSIILATPYGDITKGGGIINAFWITLNAGNSFDINVSVDVTANVDFAYNILQY